MIEFYFDDIYFDFFTENTDTVIFDNRKSKKMTKQRKRWEKMKEESICVEFEEIKV